MTYSTGWQKFIEAVRAISPSLAAILSNGHLERETDEEVEIDVFSPFHKNQLEQPKFYSLIGEAATTIGLPPKKLNFTASKLAFASNDRELRQASEQTVAEIMEMLG